MSRPRTKIEGIEFAPRRRISDLDPEELLQRSVWEWWLKVGKRAYPLVGMRAVPNGGLRSASVAGRLKAMGVVAGTADLSLTIGPEGRAAWIELKRPEIRDATKIVHQRGKQSPEQFEFQAAEISRGALYAVCDSLEQVIDQISKWTGLPPAGQGRVKPPKPDPKPANELDPVALLMAGE